MLESQEPNPAHCNRQQLGQLVDGLQVHWDGREARAQRHAVSEHYSTTRRLGQASGPLDSEGLIIGQPESSGCPPLNRRMSFADCAATGVWWCGTADQSLLEADVVYKPDSSLGGVLCCKDF